DVLAIRQLCGEMRLHVVEIGAVVVDFAQPLLARHPRRADRVIRSVHATVVVPVEAVERFGHRDQPVRCGQRGEAMREAGRELAVAVAADPELANAGSGRTEQYDARRALHAQVRRTYWCRAPGQGRVSAHAPTRNSGGYCVWKLVAS